MQQKPPALSYGYYWLTKKCGKHCKSGDSEVVFPTQPSGYFIRTFTNRFRQLLSVKPLFSHKNFQFIGNGK